MLAGARGLGTCLFHVTKHVKGPWFQSFGHGEFMEKILKFSGCTLVIIYFTKVSLGLLSTT